MQCQHIKVGAGGKKPSAKIQPPTTTASRNTTVLSAVSIK